MSVVAIQSLIPPGVVEVDPVNLMSRHLPSLIDGVDKFPCNRQDRLLVLLGIDGQGDKPHEDGAVLDHVVGDRLELDEGAEVGGGGSGLHLGDVFVM